MCTTGTKVLQWTFTPKTKKGSQKGWVLTATLGVMAERRTTLVTPALPLMSRVIAAREFSLPSLQLLHLYDYNWSMLSPTSFSTSECPNSSEKFKMLGKSTTTYWEHTTHGSY